MTSYLRPNPLVFLSSTLRGGAEVPLGIADERERIHSFGQQFGENAVWVDEISNPKLVGNPLVDIDDFLFELDRSKLYLAFVCTDWAGSPIPIADLKSEATFFEVELLYAALLGRPIVVIVRTDIPLADKTSQILELLQRVLPNSQWHRVGSLPQAESLAKSIVRQTAGGELSLHTHKRQYGQLLQHWWRWREPNNTSPALRWLDNKFISGPVAPRAAIIDECLTLATAKPSQRQKLSRLWIAARELMGVPFWSIEGTDWLEAWNKVLTAWNSAAAWYGLHGHLELGYMAALHSLRDVRERGVHEIPTRRDDPAWDAPFSSLASAYYALARRVASLRWRQRGMKRALDLIDLSTTREPITRSNVLAIRGSILRARGAFRAGVDAYREVLRLRQAAGATDGQIGEAMTELGFGLLFTLRLREGRDWLREGVSLMEQSNYGHGFIVRAKNKYAAALAVTGNLKAARQQRADASRLADESSVGRVGAR